ncbi:hypothetical protein QCA50_017362 [Cerrena zonata]|uniref:Nascent polypeptide-associated complex subunit alpha-like UBA domain-containing protein n=1 Tax=Cerrena zonata TaxID=2478898 RepID=A0AAW0FDM0_9APHY
MPNSSTSHDARFYMEQVVFLVEDTLFKISRRPFEEMSEVFCDMLSLPIVGMNASPEGQTDDHPIVLQGVKADDFRALLTLMFPPWTTVHPHALCASEWTSVLKLSTMWLMAEYRTTAIQKLEVLLGEDPVRRIVLANEYRISSWLSGAYLQLASRTDALTPQEGSSLGYECAFKVVEFRERAYRKILMDGEVNQLNNVARGSFAGFRPRWQLICDVKDYIPEFTIVEDHVGWADIDPKDIDLVVQQVGCTRTQAAHALRSCGGDLINAIMSVSE